MRIAFDDDGETVGRVSRSMIMSIDAALEALRAKGFDRTRDEINIRQDEDGSHHITLAKTVVFSCVLEPRESEVEMVAKWVVDQLPQPKAKS